MAQISTKSLTVSQFLLSWDTVIKHLTASPHSSNPTADDSQRFDALLYFIVVQLLASCYTLQNASSANNYPLFQQRKSVRLVTSLRLHSQYRFSPAAGWHARESSQSSSWPGLYTGPSLEEKVAEEASLRRRIEKHRKEHKSESMFANLLRRKSITGDWSDGPASAEGGSRRSFYSSSSGSEQSLLSKLTCQFSFLKRSKHRPHFLYDENPSISSNSRPVSYQRSIPSPTRAHISPVHRTPTHAVQVIPSTLRLRRTQSTPHKLSDLSLPRPDFRFDHHNSSTPTVGSPLIYPFGIPEIRRISATTAEG
jgi:hypothetical protein